MAPNRRRSGKEVIKTPICTITRSANPISSQIVTRRQKLMTVSANGTFKIPELLAIRKNKTKIAAKKNINSKAREPESETLSKSITDTTESVIKQVISDFVSVPCTEDKALMVPSSSPPAKVSPARKSLRSTIVPTMLNIISAAKTKRKQRPRVFSTKRKQQTHIVDSQIPTTYDISDNDNDIMSENDKNLDNFSGKKIVVSLKKDDSVVIVAYSDENHAKPTKTQKIWKIARKSTGGIPKQSFYFNSHSNDSIKQNITI